MSNETIHDTSAKTSPISGCLKRLETVEETAEKKFKRETVADTLRMKWGRLLTQAIQVHGQLLHDCQLEELERRITKLEEGKATGP